MSSIPNGLRRIIGGVPFYTSASVAVLPATEEREPFFNDDEWGDGRSPHPGRQVPPVPSSGFKSPFFADHEFDRRGPVVVNR